MFKCHTTILQLLLQLDEYGVSGEPIWKLINFSDALCQQTSSFTIHSTAVTLSQTKELTSAGFVSCYVITDYKYLFVVCSMLAINAFG